MVERRDIADKSLDELADWKAVVNPGTANDQVANAEFMRRQFVLQQQSTTAAVDTASYTRRNAFYMLLSVAVLTISGIVSASITYVQWREAHNQLTSTMKPTIDFDTEDSIDKPPIGVAIENSGPGPAIIKSITYYVDRKLVKDVSEAVQYGKLDGKQTSYFDFDEDDTLGANHKEWLFWHQRHGKEDQKELDKFVEFIDEHLGVQVRYCSVLGECWTKCSTKGRC
jgi:hypothetical protein